MAVEADVKAAGVWIRSGAGPLLLAALLWQAPQTAAVPEPGAPGPAGASDAAERHASAVPGPGSGRRDRTTDVPEVPRASDAPEAADPATQARRRKGAGTLPLGIGLVLVGLGIGLLGLRLRTG